MVHTLPPWTSKWRMAKIFGQIDSGELAARLGSPVTFDRRGNIFWYDDFEGSSQKWYSGFIGAGTASLNATRSWRGSQSMKMTSGATSGNAALIRKAFYNPSDANIGLEFKVLTDAADSEIKVYLYGYYGTKAYYGAISYSYGDKTLDYSKGTTLSWVELETDIYLDILRETWLPIKMVIDGNTAKWKRIIVGDTEYNLSGIDLVAQAPSAERHSFVVFYIFNTDNAAKTCYIDDVIITQNEP